MSAYVKKIAVIKQVKSGFSADGGAVSGLVKAETYAGFLKVEVSLINFAPLSEGRYVLGISDGLNHVIFEGLAFEGEVKFNLSSGFAFLVCFCKNTVAPIASAACGQMACALPDLKEELARQENTRPKQGGVAYDDEAIAEVNYYERADEGSAAVCQAQTQEEKRRAGDKNEEASSPVESKKNERKPRRKSDGGEIKYPRTSFHASANIGDGIGETARSEATYSDAAATAERAAHYEDSAGGLAGGDFYSRMEGDIKKIFAAYPPERDIEQAMEGSKFVKIAYGEGRYYVFGVLSVEGKPRYLCYGVPSNDGNTPPPSLKDCASYVPTANGGYWMTYQDASTGVSVKIKNA